MSGPISGARIGPVVLDSRVGRGGMGEVWRAAHDAHGVPVALKFLPQQFAHDPQRQMALNNEVRALIRLDDPGIVRVLGSGTVTAAEAEAAGLIAGTPWMMMELVQGPPLLDRAASLDWAAMRRWLLDLLDSLAHLHARRVIHRDLKPDNLRWCPVSHRPKIIDFGIAAQAGAADLFSSAGTQGFTAPEQRAGGPLGPWTDLYAVGRLAQAIFEATREHGDLLPPERLYAWIAKLLDPEPAHRFGRAADAARALACVGGAPSPIPAGLYPQGGATRATGLHPTATLGLVATSAPRPRHFPGSAPEAEIPEDWRGLGQSQRQLAWTRVDVALLPKRLGPVIAREASQDAMWAWLRAARGGEGPRCLTLYGPRGVGRTRLLEWLAHRAHEVGAVDVRWADEPAPEAPCHGRSRRRLLWVIDDVQAHPDQARAALAASAESDGPLVLLSCALTGTEASAGWLQDCSEAGETLPVAPLGPGQMSRMIQSLLPVTWPTAVALAMGSCGLPAAAQALIQAHLGSGLLETDSSPMAPWSVRLDHPLDAIVPERWMARSGDTPDPRGLLTSADWEALGLGSLWGWIVPDDGWRAVCEQLDAPMPPGLMDRARAAGVAMARSDKQWAICSPEAWHAARQAAGSAHGASAPHAALLRETEALPKKGGSHARAWAAVAAVHAERVTGDATERLFEAASFAMESRANGIASVLLDAIADLSLSPDHPHAVRAFALRAWRLQAAKVAHGDVESALALGKALLESEIDPRQRALVLDYVSGLLDLLSRSAESLTAALESVRLAVGTRRAPHSAYQLGSRLHFSGHLQPGVSCYAFARRGFLEQGHPNRAAMCLVGQGLALAWAKRFAEAVEVVEQAGETLRSNESLVWLGNCLDIRGLIALRSGNPEDGIRFARQSIDAYHKAGLHGRTVPLINLSAAHLDLDDHATAAQILDEAFRLSTAQRRDDLLAAVHLALSRVATARRDSDAWHAHATEARRLIGDTIYFDPSYPKMILDAATSGEAFGHAQTAAQLRQRAEIILEAQRAAANAEITLPFS